MVRRKKHDLLSKEQSEQLERALGDGFQIYGGMQMGFYVPLDGVIDEPFFGARAKSGRRRGEEENVVEFVEELRAEGLPEEEIADEIESYLDECQPEDAPRWLETNPFEFDLKEITRFFEDRVDEIREEIRSDHEAFWRENLRGHEPEPIPEWVLEPSSMLLGEEPYSKKWFEIHVIGEIESIAYWKEYRSNSPTAERLHLSSAGRIGRMIEHYRWRFSYGAHALRGKSNLRAATGGGKARAEARAPETMAILTKMDGLIGRGRSCREAGRRVFEEGLGKSADANRKLFERHSSRATRK